MSFLGFSFSGLDLNIYSGFNPEIHFKFQFQFKLISQQFRIVFLQGSAVKPMFWTFFSTNYCSLAQQSRIRVFKFGFQNPGFQILNPKKGHSLVYFNRLKGKFNLPSETWPIINPMVVIQAVTKVANIKNRNRQIRPWLKNFLDRLLLADWTKSNECKRKHHQVQIF